MTDDVIVISSDSDSDVEPVCSRGQPEVVINDYAFLTKCNLNFNTNWIPLTCNVSKITKQSATALPESKEWTKSTSAITQHTVYPYHEFNPDPHVTGNRCDSPDSLKSCGRIYQNISQFQIPGISHPVGRDNSPVDDLVPPVKRTRREDLNEPELSGGEANSSVEYLLCSPKLSTSPTSFKVEPLSSNHASHDPPIGSNMLFTSSEDAQEKKSDCPSEPISIEDCRKCGASPPFEPEDCPTVVYINDSPISINWDDDDWNSEDSTFEEKTQFICPVALNQLMSGKTLAPVKDEKPKPSQLLTSQLLNLISCTVDENYTEGTLQLVSDFLKSGCHPPKKVTSHLLCGVLLNPKSTLNHCVCAFSLLMKTQRNRMADSDTVPWSWHLLASVMDDENPTKMLRSEVVRMFLEYVLQTLTDDYAEKLSNSDLHNSIAKATLSCDRHFSQVRDVIRWICATIVKSPGSDDKIEASKEMDEKIRIVSSLQRMLSLALDVDQCPALISSKLCQELFSTLITSMRQRDHRMMFLESLQSQPLRCKLLEQLLECFCPVKVCLPMSLSLLLHFVRNCSPIPNLKGGEEKWRDWEELLQLFWMLLLSYNKTMKGYLGTSASTPSSSSSNTIFKKEDRLTKASVCEGFDTFRSRSLNDLDCALPIHVEDSLRYLMEYLLNVCQE